MDLKINNYKYDYNSSYINKTSNSNINFENTLAGIRKITSTQELISNNLLYKNNTTNSVLKNKEITDPDCLARLEELKNTFNTQEKRENSVQSIEMIENVMKLDISNNKDRYYNSGILNIEQVFNDCGISLNNCSPKEASGIFTELSSEGLIDKKEAKNMRMMLGMQAASSQCELEEKGVYNVSGYSVKGDFKEFLQLILKSNNNMILDLINMI